MEFVDECGSNLSGAGEVYGMGLVRSTSFGRKRIALPNVDLVFESDVDCFTPKHRKRQRLPDSCFCTERSALEDLPQEILIRILCGVEHDDLKRLFFVSKGVREATLIAKQSHFAYSTPKKTLGFHNEVEEYFCDATPLAPKQSRVSRWRLSAKKLADISVALFPSSYEEDLFLGL